MVLDRFIKKKASKEDDQERRRVAAVIDTAILQRSKIHIRFEETATAITGVTGLILAMDGGAMVLELSGLSALKDHFIGRSMTCFCRILDREDKHREIFYTFTTKILRIRQTKTGVQIAVTVPDAVDGSQRRKSLRLKPDLQKFSHLAFWKYDASGGFDIAKPTISYAHFKAARSLLENVSAGGMRLNIRRDLIKEQQIALQKGDRFIVFFTFAEQLTKLRNEYWLVVKINNIRIDTISGDMVLGMEYVAHGLRQADSGKIAWNKVDDNVIDDLAQRIYHWHLTLYRERGLV
jgi:hypothetical protein